jgi:hypothetical protein
MLSQYSHIVANEPMVIFTLMNQLQRHSVSQSLSCKIKSDRRMFEKFTEIVTAENFHSRCDRASQNPNGIEAQNLLRQLLPLLRVSGGRVPFGPVEQARSLSDLYAMCRRFGLPTMFLTFAPNYLDPLTI